MAVGVLDVEFGVEDLSRMVFAGASVSLVTILIISNGYERDARTSAGRLVFAGVSVLVVTALFIAIGTSVTIAAVEENLLKPY